MKQYMVVVTMVIPVSVDEKLVEDSPERLGPSQWAAREAERQLKAVGHERFPKQFHPIGISFFAQADR